MSLNLHPSLLRRRVPLSTVCDQFFKRCRKHSALFFSRFSFCLNHLRILFRCPQLTSVRFTVVRFFHFRFAQVSVPGSLPDFSCPEFLSRISNRYAESSLAGVGRLIQ